MIDRNGRRVNIGWSQEEMIWLEAAIELGCERADLEDIADMSGRSFEAVKQMAYRMRAAQLQGNKGNPSVTRRGLAVVPLSKRTAGNARCVGHRERTI